MTTVGILHPGEMGGSIAAALTSAGHSALWASDGRSDDTSQRANGAGMIDVHTIDAILERSSVVFSICPPHAAIEVVKKLSTFDGIFVDANAIAPSTTEVVAQRAKAVGATFVDGGILGPPPVKAGTTRLFLSGQEASSVAHLFEESIVDPVVLEGSMTSASALKMSFAAWSKGTLALILTARALAHSHGVEAALEAEWDLSHPKLNGRSLFAAQQAASKGWRWTGEMQEIAKSMEKAGLPVGFHEAAADIYARVPRTSDAGVDKETLARVVDLVLGLH